MATLKRINDVRLPALIQSLKSDQEVDRRIVEILDGLTKNDDDLNTQIKNIEIPTTDVIPVPYVAGDFTAIAPMGWTVTAPQLQSFTYSIQDNMMELTVRIIGSTLITAPSNELQINIPGGFAVAGNPARADQWFGCGDVQDAAQTPALIIASALTPTVIRILKVPIANFVLGALTVRIQIRFAIGNAILKGV